MKKKEEKSIFKLDRRCQMIIWECVPYWIKKIAYLLVKQIDALYIEGCDELGAQHGTASNTCVKRRFRGYDILPGGLNSPLECGSLMNSTSSSFGDDGIGKHGTIISCCIPSSVVTPVL